jgi:CheY-like chemotaxis protein
MTGKKTKHVMVAKACRFIYGNEAHGLGDYLNVDKRTYDKHKGNRLVLVEDLEEEDPQVEEATDGEAPADGD